MTTGRRFSNGRSMAVVCLGGPSTDTATGHEWAGVDAGTYTITVSARNVGGWSPPATATVQVTDSPLPPPPPATPTVDASGGEYRASASWFADDNGSPILGWEIDGGGLSRRPRHRPPLPATNGTGVDAGTYTIRVRARNAGGWSQPATADRDRSLILRHNRRRPRPLSTLRVGRTGPPRIGPPMTTDRRSLDGRSTAAVCLEGPGYRRHGQPRMGRRRLLAPTQSG